MMITIIIIEAECFAVDSLLLYNSSRKCNELVDDADYLLIFMFYYDQIDIVKKSIIFLFDINKKSNLNTSQISFMISIKFIRWRKWNSGSYSEREEDKNDIDVDNFIKIDKENA